MLLDPNPNHFFLIYLAPQNAIQQEALFLLVDQRWVFNIPKVLDREDLKNIPIGSFKFER